MKKQIINMLVAIIITIVAVCIYGIAGAGDISYLPNNAGGKIVFTDDPCTNGKKGLNVYGTSAKGMVRFGCWTMFKNSSTVWVVWDDDGSVNAYDASNVTLTEYGSLPPKKTL